MTFFNKKEEVISIELTPYGRSLLSQGKLMPSFYSFFDDDILYDSSAAGTNSETNNQVYQRIINETPRLKPQRDLVSPEGNIFSNERSEKQTRPHTKLKTNYMTEPMGTSDQKNDNAPSWKNTFLQGELTGSTESYLTGSDIYLKQIPQIESIIEYEMQVRNRADDPPVRGQEISPSAPVSQIFPDGSYIDLTEEQILCQLKELGGFTLKDGIELEVYMYDDTSSETLIPLSFLPRQQSIIDGILIDEGDPIDNEIDIDPSYVEYYLDLNLDKEISNTDICIGVNKLKARDVQIGLEVECLEVDVTDFDIYGTRIGGSGGGDGGSGLGGSTGSDPGNDLEICE